jgi:uncharacterized membrane protein YtjA (UPF0391 family)
MYVNAVIFIVVSERTSATAGNAARLLFFIARVGS